MELLLEAFSDYLPIITHAVVRGMVIFILALGFVYIVGRMLGIVEHYRAKNIIALLVMIVASYVSVLIYDNDLLVHEWEVYWRALVYTAVSAIFYVLIGFDLYKRFNAWSDKKFIKVKEEKKNEKEKNN